jgi:hypothetical protein
VDEPFVGRGAELAELDRQFALAVSGQGRVVVLAGPAGGGKTALIGRCLPAWSAAADTVLVWGDEAETALAGGLLGQLVPPGRVVPADQAGDLAEVLARGRADPLSAGWAVLALLRERARAGPLVVVVDDAQWGDELSLRALGFAARRLQTDPVLCVIATRTDGLARLSAGLVRVAAERGARLDLLGLDAGEVAVLAELAGAGRLPGRAAERLREHTGGIPLHVRELLHDLPGPMLRMPGVSLPAPRSLQALVASRLAVCTADTEALVVAAAVLGGDCELADAATLAGLGDPLPALQQAISQRLLAEPPAAGRRRVAFPHALIRAAIYGDIGVARRAALHRAAAGLTSGSVGLAHRVAGCAGPDSRLAADLAARAAEERAAGQLAAAAEHLLMAARVTGDRSDAEGWLAEAVGLLIDQEMWPRPADTPPRSPRWPRRPGATCCWAGLTCWPARTRLPSSRSAAPGPRWPRTPGPPRQQPARPPPRRPASWPWSWPASSAWPMPPPGRSVRRPSRRRSSPGLVRTPCRAARWPPPGRPAGPAENWKRS